MEKLTVPGSGNFFGGIEKKFFVKKMKKNFVTFCLIKLNANRFLQNRRGRGDVPVQKLGLFFQS